MAPEVALEGIIDFLRNMTLPEAIASVLAIVGVWLMSIPNFYGQITMLVAQGFWLTHAYETQQPGLLLQSFLLFLINIKAIVSWYNKRIGLKSVKEFLTPGGNL